MKIYIEYNNGKFLLYENVRRINIEYNKLYIESTYNSDIDVESLSEIRRIETTKMETKFDMFDHI